MLVDGERCRCQLLQVEVLRFLDRDTDELDGPTFKCPGGLVARSDCVTAIVADAESVARQGELANLCAHWTFRHNFLVDVELRLAHGLVVWSGTLPDELHPERVFTRLEFRGDELLFRLDAEEVVNVLQLLVGDEQRVTTEARSVGENYSRAIGIGDLDIGEDLVRTSAHVDGRTFRNRRGSRIVDVPLARWFFGWSRSAEDCHRIAVVERQH